jgi:tetratricopeptide (TPR) repeat protein
VDELRSHRRRRSPCFVCWLLALTLSAGQVSVARAADTPSAEGAATARRSEARAKFDEGVKAFAEQRYADAVQAFQEADAIEPSAPLSFNIARSYEKLDDTSAALRWYRDYMRRNSAATNAAEVNARIAALADTLAKRGVQQLTVLSAPPGASVSVDQRIAGKTPLTLELPPGPHHLKLELPEYQALEADFTLEARTPQDLKLSLTPSRPAAIPPSASTGVDATPRPVPAAPAPGKRPFGVVPYVLGGAGAVSLLGALGFELARRSAESAAKDGTQPEYPEHYDSMRGRQTTARVLAGVGGALLVTGGVLFVLNKPQKQKPQVGLACGSGGCALSAFGSFH